MKSNIITKTFTSPYGELIMGSFEDKLCLCDWVNRSKRKEIDRRICYHLEAEYVQGDSAVIEKTIRQLKEYFKGDRKEFRLPILFAGSDFQNRVWAELLKIPYGNTETYLRLSQKLKNDKVIRAVAAANGANAISIIVPCHRIIGSKGELTGYAGGLQVKKKLLILEGALKDPEQLSFFS